MAIIEVPDISVVKTVNGIKQLLSLRDQKIKKDGVLNTFGVGSGVKCNGDLYVLESEEEKEPIVIPEDEVDLVIQFSSNATNLSFYTVGGFSFDYIDWGDGNIDVNVVSGSSSKKITHSYVDNEDIHSIKCYYKNKSLDRTTSEVNLNGMGITSFSASIPITKLTLHNNNLTSFSTNKQIELQTLYCYNNQGLASLDITAYSNMISSVRCYNCNLNSLQFKTQHTSLKDVWCYDNPLVTNQSALTQLANSLPNRTGTTAGYLYIKNNTSKAWIQAVCTSKNWTVE